MMPLRHDVGAAIVPYIWGGRPASRIADVRSKHAVVERLLRQTEDFGAQ